MIGTFIRVGTGFLLGAVMVKESENVGSLYMRVRAKLSSLGAKAMETNTLVWSIVPQDDDRFALALTNPSVVDSKAVGKLLDRLVRASAHHDIPFNADARNALQVWLDDPSRPLPSQAYGRISNWFVGGQIAARNSKRGYAAKRLWSGFFCAEPIGRLTDTRDNGAVLSGPFEAWWKTQSAWQEMETGGD